jgi:hypothetical protein
MMAVLTGQVEMIFGDLVRAGVKQRATWDWAFSRRLLDLMVWFLYSCIHWRRIHDEHA